ncbi:hypothetical protein LCGC14_1548990 [marine sediment metagenome]|uniref:Uncharacterized protein n=1 Tax=marine sediment metagenome TaxID=412755 RepID=A0A0F9LRP1_9ZZZZ
MKVRIYCRKHKRHHSLHANFHCKNGFCRPGRKSVCTQVKRRK